MALHIGPGLRREGSYNRLRNRWLRRQQARDQAEIDAQQQRAAENYMRSRPDDDRRVTIQTGREGMETLREIFNPQERDMEQEMHHAQHPPSSVYSYFQPGEVDDYILDAIHNLRMEDEDNAETISIPIANMLDRIMAPTYGSAAPTPTMVNRRHVSALLARFLRVAYQTGFDRGNQAASMQDCTDTDKDFERANDNWYDRNVRHMNIDGTDYNVVGTGIRTLAEASDRPVDWSMQPMQSAGLVDMSTIEIQHIMAGEALPPTQLYQDAASAGSSNVR